MQYPSDFPKCNCYQKIDLFLENLIDFQLKTWIFSMRNIVLFLEQQMSSLGLGVDFPIIESAAEQYPRIYALECSHGHRFQGLTSLVLREPGVCFLTLHIKRGWLASSVRSYSGIDFPAHLAPVIVQQHLDAVERTYASFDEKTNRLQARFDAAARLVFLSGRPVPEFQFYADLLVAWRKRHGLNPRIESEPSKAEIENKVKGCRRVMRIREVEGE